MSLIQRSFLPENLASDPTSSQVRPIAKISIAYDPPPGQTVDVVSVLGAVINGVDVVKHFDSVINPEMITLGRQLWHGNYLVGLAQRVEHRFPAGVARFSTGALWSAGAAWDRPLPMSARVYRPHGLSFPTAFNFIRNGMDPIWSKHEDGAVIGQVVGTMRQAGECETISMISTRNTTWVDLVEPVDRFDGPVVQMDGAVSDVVPYLDVEVLYDLGSNSRGYLWGVDYVINSRSRVVFLCADAPGRVSSAAVISDIGTPPRPAAGQFKKATTVSLSSVAAAIFSADSISKITGFDWFVTPPLSPDPGGVYPSDTAAIGKIIAYVPKTGESFTIYDSSVSSTVFNGTVTFRAPIVLAKNEALKIYRVSQDGSAAAVDVTVWLKRRVTLVGPHSHIANERLNYFWNQVVGQGHSLTLQDKLIAMAGMKARTEKSIGSFATFVEAILGCPLSPFDGAFVTELRQPDLLGYVPGQIGIYGAVQEFDISLDLPVAAGDAVSLLQSLLGSSDGVAITDIYSDPNFMQFFPDGSPPPDDPSALAYVRSKIVGPVTLPDDFIAQYPTGTPVFLAAEILKIKSFRIDLGVYASRRFFSDPALQQRIFDAIDIVKPSGTDYWLRLSDGTAIIKSSPIIKSINVSSNLDLPTDYAQRIFNDEAFAEAQFYNFYVATTPGSLSKIGDQYMLSLFDGGSQSSVQTLSLADFNGHPLFPMDAIYERWAAAINAFAPASTYIVADVFRHMLRIRVKIAIPGNLEFVRYTTPFTASAKQIYGDGTVSFNHATATLIAPDDISKVFRSLDESIGTMNGYRELFITGGATFALLSDFGSGPFDPTFVSLANPSTTPYTAAVTPVFGTGARIGRLRLEGFVYSQNGAMDGSITIGYTAAGTFGVGDSLLLTVAHSDPAVLPAPIVLMRTKLATDTSMDSVFAGMGGLVMADPTLMQYFTADYPVAPATTPPTNLVITPINPDDPALSGFALTLDASAGAPTLYIANSAGSTTAPGPISKAITPSAPPVMTVSFAPSWGGFPTRTATGNVYSPSASGGGNFFSRDILSETIPAPGVSPITVSISISAGAYGTPRPVAIQNMRIVTSNYPEYSRDDNDPFVLDAFRETPIPTTFTDGVVTDPFHQNPPVVVPNPAPNLYYRKNNVILDATPRLVAPSQTLILRSADDYAYVQIYLAGVVALRTVKQNKVGPIPVTINFLAATPILYLDNGDGIFSDLVLGTHYTEASPTITLINTVAHPALTTSRVVGYAKSPDYLYYYQGPRAPSRTTINRISSAAGVRALYNEPLPAGPNDFRAANKDAAGGPIAAPYAVPDYLASGVKDNPAFKTDTEAVKFTDTAFSIKRVR